MARRTGVSQPAVQKAVKILQAEGYVECDGMHIYLTAAGQSYAERVYSRHRTITSFLLALGVDAAACEMEHVLSETTVKAFEDFLKGR